MSNAAPRQIGGFVPSSSSSSSIVTGSGSVRTVARPRPARAQLPAALPAGPPVHPPRGWPLLPRHMRCEVLVVIRNLLKGINRGSV
jgi:hypothetical protein